MIDLNKPRLTEKNEFGGEKMNDKQKMCPMTFSKQISLECGESGCAWWCNWMECCALVGIAAQIDFTNRGRKNEID